MAVFSRLATAVQLFSIILTPALGAVTSKDYDYVIIVHVQFCSIADEQ